MTTTPDFLARYTPEYVAQLEAQFNRVKNRHNWKDPVSAVVDLTEAERVVMADAIGFYTGSVAEFITSRYGQALPDGRTARPGATFYRVYAKGYYSAVGA